MTVRENDASNLGRVRLRERLNERGTYTEKRGEGGGKDRE